MNYLAAEMTLYVRDTYLGFVVGVEFMFMFICGSEVLRRFCHESVAPRLLYILTPHRVGLSYTEPVSTPP